MKAIVRILFCYAVFSFIACGGDNPFVAKLHHLDSLLIEHPDSVYQVLGGMEKEAHAQSESSRMYYELLRADAQNKAYIDFTTDSVMLQVADYYDQHGTANEQMRAHYLLGCTYRDLKDVPMELQCFLEATEKADTTQKDCDLYTLYAIYGQMADIYDSQYLPEEELKALRMCEQLSLLDKDTLSAIKAYELRLRPYYLLNKHDSVLLVTKNARKNYLKFNKVKEAAQLLGPCISILLTRTELDSARTYMNIFERESGYFVNGRMSVTNAKLYYYYKGKLKLIDNKIDSAKYYFNELQKAGWKEAAYEGFVQLYKKTNNADSLAKYADLYVKANDSARVSTNSQAIAQMTAMYNYGREKRIADNAKAQLIAEKDKSSLFAIIILVLVSMAVLLSYGIARNRRSNINKIKELNQEIEHKTSLLLEASQKNDDEELHLIKESLRNAQQELAKYRESDTLTAFYESEIYQLFRKHSKGPCRITMTEWETLTALFNSTFSRYADFIHTGKSMTDDQIKVCMLIRIGFAEFEMANILNVDNKRITRIKSQVNQKLFSINNAKELADNLKSHF